MNEKSKIMQREAVRNIQSWLTKYMKASNLSQRGLANQLGVSKQQVWSILQENWNPSIKIICNIANILNISPSSILKKPPK